MEYTKTRPKNRRIGFLFKCFKPDNVVLDESLSSPKAKTADPLLTYIAVAQKEGVVLPTVLSATLKVEKGDDDEGSGCLRRKKSNDSSIRQALMDALNETTLGKKIIKRRKTKKKGLFRSSIRNLEGEGDIISDPEGKITQGNISDTSFSSQYCSSAFTPSLQSSSTNSSRSWGTQASGFSSDSCPPRSMPVIGTGVMKQKQDIGDIRKGIYVSNMTVCLLLTTLLVLILWGKLCAILWTSIGFYIVPHRLRRACNEGSLL